MSEAVGIVLSPVNLEGGKIELTKHGEKLYSEGKLVSGSLLMVKSEGAKHVILTTSVKESNVIYEEQSVFQALRKLGIEIEAKLEAESGGDLRQVVMDFVIIGEIYENDSGPRLDRAYRPPSPGSKVYQLRERDREYLFQGIIREVDKACSGKLCRRLYAFGNVIGSEGLRGIALWPRINLHLGIVGTTGSGKSFTAGAVIEALEKFEDYPVTTSVFVFDVHGEYVNAYGSEFRGSWDDVKVITLEELEDSKSNEAILGLNFVIEEEDIFEGEAKKEPLYTPSEFSTIVKSIYKAQSGVYRTLIEKAFDFEDKHGDRLGIAFLLDEVASIEDEREKREEFIRGLKGILNAASEVSDVSYSSSSINAALRALEAFASRVLPYIRKGPKYVGPEKLVELARGHNLVIFDLSARGAGKADVVVKDIAISYVLRVLYTKLADEFYESDKRLVFIIDEAQTFIPARSYATGADLTKSIVRQIASQGRKFGFSLVLISQRPAFMDQHVFSLMNSLIIHRTAIGDADFIVKTFGLSRSLAATLANQRTGEAFVYGRLFEIPMRIKIVKGVDRRRVL